MIVHANIEAKLELHNSLKTVNAHTFSNQYESEYLATTRKKEGNYIFVASS